MILLQVIVSGILAGFVYALIAMGLSLIWGVMDLVNFAHGEFLMISMYTAYWAWALWSIDPLISLPAVALLLAAGGALTYKLVIRKVLDAPMLSQILCTFGLVILFRGLAQFFWSPNYRQVMSPILKGRLDVGGLFLSVPQLGAALGALLAAGFLYWLINGTELGWALQATAEDKQAAALMGIDSERMFTIAWAIGIGSVGVAGALLANYYYIFPMVGMMFGLFALVAVALGGFGSIGGALIAGIILGLVESLSGYLVAPAYKYLFVFLIYIAVVMWRPQGLFGTH